MAALARLFRAAALAASMATISAYGSLPAAERQEDPVTPGPGATTPLDLGPDIARFYRDRGFRPLWIEGTGLRPETSRLLGMLPRNPSLEAAVQAAQSGDRYALTRADLLLTRAYAAHLESIGQGPAENPMRYIDAELKPTELPVRAHLDRLASAPALADHLASAGRRNPAFDGLVRGLRLYRARWSSLPQHKIGESGAERLTLARRLGVHHTSERAFVDRVTEFQRVHGLARTGRADRATITALDRGAGYYEQLIERNIDRARAIPALKGRYLLVDTASALLWLIEDGQVRDRMKVIVGRRDMQTPVMAGLIRHVVLNPYWNLPPDLVRQRARVAVRRGAGVLADERLQVLSDWSDDARLLDTRRVDWAAVASGRTEVNLRQLPGPHNMMGAIKFMFPNDLGIYLHDTPLRDHFTRSERRISSGCVRVEDWARLARWLFHGAAPRPSGVAEQQVELSVPIPVYITYLTALPTSEGVVFQPDGYGRDRVRAESARNREARATL